MDIGERVLGHGLRWWARHGGIAQFHRPAGAAGHVAGWIMGRRSSNVTRNRWAAKLLDVGPAERVLELGCGPGVAVAALAGRATRGLVVGVDHSPVMIRQARRRNRAAVQAGRVRLVPTPVERLSLPGEPFDAALAVNTLGMWPEPAARLRELARLLRPGGRIALVSQPRCTGATAATSVAAAEELASLLAEAGFVGLRTETLDLDPPVVCVIGYVSGRAAPAPS
ncbi:class I SAM-dependent methyltransferase [Amycolatopsis sp. NPDC049252]|uniref:class I SAM-dependent methyltransferase n=1 Tax=Amycolatopsis sp. NPDC049252 TaxID=3363933 RepID=UPI0037217CDD